MFRLVGQTIELKHVRNASPDNHKFYNLPMKSCPEKIVDLKFPFPVKFGGKADLDKGYLNNENRVDYVRHMLHLEYKKAKRMQFQRLLVDLMTCLHI